MKRTQGTDNYVWDGPNLLAVRTSGGDVDKATGYGPQIVPGIGGMDYQYDSGAAAGHKIPVHLEDQVGTSGLVLAENESTITDYNFKAPDLSAFGEKERGAEIADGERVLGGKQFVNPSAAAGERDVEVYDFGARLWDPGQGLFLSADPLITGIGVVGVQRTPFASMQQLIEPIIMAHGYGSRANRRAISDQRLRVWGLASRSGARGRSTSAHADPVNAIDALGYIVVFVSGNRSSGSREPGDTGFRGLEASPELSGHGAHFKAHYEVDDIGDEFVKWLINYIGEHPCEPVILIGHSWGGEAAMGLANLLGKVGLKVDVLIQVDSVEGAGIGDPSSLQVPGNVGAAFNFYRGNQYTEMKSRTNVEGAWNIRVGGLHEDVNEPGASGEALTHTNIDNDARVHRLIRTIASRVPKLGINCANWGTVRVRPRSVVRGERLVLEYFEEVEQYPNAYLEECDLEGTALEFTSE